MSERGRVVSAPHEQLSAYIDDELEPEARAELESKLGRSPKLRAALGKMRRADAAVSAWLADAPPEAIAAVVKSPAAPRRWPWALAATVAAAAALLLWFLSPNDPVAPDPVGYLDLVTAMVEDHGAFARGDMTPERSAGTLASATRWLGREHGLPASFPYRDGVLASATRCTLLDTPVAAVFVSRDEELVSTFAVSSEGVREATRAAPFPGRCAAHGDASTCEWSDAGWRYVAVSRRDPAGLRDTLIALAR